MNEVIDFLTANTTIAYLTAVIIFIITIIMLMKRLIGVVVTIVLLAFALLSGLAIANHDLFREILIGFKYPENSTEDPYSHYKHQLHKAFDEIKEEAEKQTRKLEAIYEAYKSPHEKEVPAPTKPKEK